MSPLEAAQIHPPILAASTPVPMPTNRARFFSSKRGLLRILSVKITLPVILTMLLFVTTFFGFIIPSFEAHLMDRKREMIHALTESAMSSIRYYNQLAENGTMTTRQAQQQAIAHLRSLRYGPDGKDYFWINDTHPRMIMHPYLPDMEGQDVTDSKDPAGKKLFQAFLATVQQNGAGFVKYHWQWQDDPTRVFSKMSYLQEFTPWQWIIGTGLYVEDVQAQITAITHRMSLICLGIFLLIALLSTYVIWQGVSVENRRLKSEASLKKSEAKYRLLAETAQEIVMILDNDLHISCANSRWFSLCGLPPDRVNGRPLFDLLSATDQSLLDQRLAAIRQGRSGVELLETEFHLEGGQSIPVEATFAMMTTQEGSTNFLMAARDITEKRKIATQAKLQQEQLLQTDKMASLGTLVSGVAHEINNPIASVMLNIQVFQKFWHHVLPVLDQHHQQDGHFEVSGMAYPQLRERIPKLLEFSMDGVVRVKRIVGDLKDFASPRPADVVDNVDLNLVVEKSVGLVSSLIKKTTADFKTHYGTGLPIFKGNSHRLEQVVINLLVNACQATCEANRPLRVTTGYQEKTDELFIEVRDSGQGIPPEIIRRIKDPFFTTKRDDGGTGLGLAISDTIVRDHGGRLIFRSQAGVGTIVTVRFPTRTTLAIDRQAA